MTRLNPTALRGTTPTRLPRRTRSTLTWPALLLTGALVASACGGGSDDDATPTDTAQTTTTTTGDVSVTTADVSVTTADVSVTTADDGGTETTVADTAGPVDTPPATTAPAEEDPGVPADADLDAVLRFGADLVGSAAAGQRSFDLREVTGNVTTVGMFYSVYGGLMRRTPNGELIPDLAESAEAVDDSTILITLRPELTFSDGTPFDAEAVKTGLDLMVAEGNPLAVLETFKQLASVDVVSPTELQLNITDGASSAWFDSFMGSWETMIMKPDYTDFENPIGAGPMLLTEWQKEQSMTFTKSPSYWNADAILVAGLEVTHAPDPVSVSNAVRSDQIDAGQINPASAAQFDPERVLAFAGQDKAIHFMTCKRDVPLDDVRVRKALNLAVDRDILNEVAYNGLAEPMDGLWPTGHVLDNPDVSLSYDPDQARALLEEAGYGDGFEVDLYIIPIDPLPTLAELVQQMFADVGVTLNINASANYVQDFLIPQVAGLGLVPAWGANRGVFGQWSGEVAGNTCGYSDPDLDATIAELNTIGNADPQAVELWHELEAKIIEEDTLSVFLLFGSTIVATGDKVGAFVLMPYLIPWPELHDTYLLAS